MAKKFSITNTNNNSNVLTTPFTTAGVKNLKLASVYIYEEALKLIIRGQYHGHGVAHAANGYFNSSGEGNFTLEVLELLFG